MFVCVFVCVCCLIVLSDLASKKTDAEPVARGGARRTPPCCLQLHRSEKYCKVNRLVREYPKARRSRKVQCGLIFERDTVQYMRYLTALNIDERAPRGDRDNRQQTSTRARTDTWKETHCMSDETCHTVTDTHVYLLLEPEL